MAGVGETIESPLTGSGDLSSRPPQVPVLRSCANYLSTAILSNPRICV